MRFSLRYTAIRVTDLDRALGFYLSVLERRLEGLLLTVLRPQLNEVEGRINRRIKHEVAPTINIRP